MQERMTQCVVTGMGFPAEWKEREKGKGKERAVPPHRSGVVFFRSVRSVANVSRGERKRERESSATVGRSVQGTFRLEDLSGKNRCMVRLVV